MSIAREVAPAEAPVESRWRQFEATVPFIFSGYALAATASGHPLAVDIAISAAVLYQVAIAIWYSGKRRFRVQSVGGTLLTGAFAITLPSTRFSYVLVPAGFACLLVALGRVQTAAVLGRAAHALRKRRFLEDEPDDARRRDAAALSLVLPAVVIALLALPLASWIVAQERRFLERMREPPPVVEQTDWFTERNRPANDAPRPGTTGLKFAGDPAGKTRPDIGRTDMNGSDPYLDRRVLMEITPTQGGEPTGDLGPLYLRGIPLVDDHGAWIEDLSRVVRVEDATDGRTDGWCDLSVRPRAADAVDFAIHQDAPIYPSENQLLALCPPGTSSIEAKAVRGAPGGPFLVPVKSATDTFDYRLVGRRPERVPYPGPSTRFATGDPRASAKFGGTPVWSDLKELARVATVGAATDIDIAKAVTEHLRAKFKYQKVNDPFLRGRRDELRDFITRGGGTCVEFAKAGVVMLRSLGVPARVGRGLLVGWYDADQKYLGRACDGHAWIEVAFDGCGWVVFDPTPGAPDDGGATRPPPEDPQETEQVPVAGETGWLPSLDDAVGGARSRVQKVYDWIAEHWVLCLVAAAVVAAFIRRASRQRTERLSGGERPSPTFKRSSWERLSFELARRGFRRRPSQTATEFAEAVVAAGGPVYEPYVSLTERQQAARFRGAKLTPDDEDAFDEFRRTIAQVAAEVPA